MYSINEIARKTGISKVTLRYYDEIDILKPKRRENNYRYYDDDDVLDLQYIEVMKFADFTLREIKKIIQLKHNPEAANHKVIIDFLSEKDTVLSQKIQTYITIQNYLSEMKDIMLKKKSMADAVYLDEFVEDLFRVIRKKDK